MNILKSIKEIKKGYLIVIGVLSLAVFVQACFLLNTKQSMSDQEFVNNIGESNNTSLLMQKLSDKFENDSKNSNDIFDSFFNDDFFEKEDNPFKALQEMRKRLSESFSGKNLNFFNPGRDNWFGSKFGTGDIEITTKDKDDKIVMTFKIPGLKNNTMNIDINDKRIKLNCDIEEKVEKEDQDGNTVYQSKSHRRMSKVLPVPGNVDTDNPNVETNDDELIITFQKIFD